MAQNASARGTRLGRTVRCTSEIGFCSLDRRHPTKCLQEMMIRAQWRCDETAFCARERRRAHYAISQRDFACSPRFTPSYKFGVLRPCSKPIMIGMKKAGAEQAQQVAVKRVREWLVGMLPPDEREEDDGGTAEDGQETSIIVNQLACKEVGCPDVELVITLLRAKPRPKLMFKIYKAAADLPMEEVEAELKKALAEERGEAPPAHDHAHDESAKGGEHGHAHGDDCGGCCDGHHEGEHGHHESEHGHHESEHGHDEHKKHKPDNEHDHA